MKTNQQINTKTEEVLDQVVEVSDKLYQRVKTIDFSKDAFESDDLNDLRLHLGYTKTYSDLAKVRLQYMKYDVT